MARTVDRGLKLYVGFLVLLTVSSAQVAWWVGENVHYSRATAARLTELYHDNAAAYGDQQSTLPSYIVIDRTAATDPARATGSARVDPAAIEALQAASESRARRYYWEGGFFLFVLLSGMAVIATAIRHDAALRRRQQNFLAGVSHEFKSPLASIRLAAETLQMRCADEDARRWVPRIIADCDRLLRTVDNLLDTARLDEGAHRILPDRIELSRVVRNVVDSMRVRAESDGIELTIDALDTVDINADRTALESILTNLIDNAIKACAAIGSKRITVSAVNRAQGIELVVSDDGMGFPAAESSQLFEKFYRVGNEMQRATPGSGLGLYIVQQLAALSGARVSAHSDGPGRGATFTVHWPEARLHG